jgi:hypothetical protein
MTKKVKAVFPQSMRASRVKTSMTPTKGVLAEYADRILSAAAGTPIPPTRGLTLKNYETKLDKDCPPVVVAMRRVAEIRQSTWKQWVNNYTPVLMHKSRWRELWMFFTTNRYFFVEYHLIKNSISGSIIYSNRRDAMYAYQQGQIVWIEVYPVEQGIKVPGTSVS